MPQTQVQRTDALRIGSVKFEIGDDIGSLVNVGALREAKLYEEYDKLEIKSDNAGVVMSKISNRKVVFEASLMELDLDIVGNQLQKGLFEYSTQAAAPVAVVDEVIIMNENALNLLANKDGDNTRVASIVLTDSTGAITYVEGVDYEVAVNPEGYTGLVIIATITDGQSCKVDYSYTPLAHKKITAGDQITLTPRVIRLTNTDTSGKEFKVTIYRATNAEPFNISYVADDAEDVSLQPIKFEGTADATRSAVDNIFEIIDEQSIT